MDFLTRVGMMNNQQILRQSSAKRLVNPADSVDRQHRKRHLTSINELLNFDMSARLKLKVALFRIIGKITNHNAIDINREGIMSLYEVWIVAVHRANQIANRSPHNGVQARSEAAGR